MSSHEIGTHELLSEQLIAQMSVDVRQDYVPSMSYHSWEGHILPGLVRIDQLEASGKATDVNRWPVVRAAWLGHDRFLTQTKLDPSLLESYASAEDLAADKHRDSMLAYGVDEETANEIHYCILATNPKYPCETPEARAVCQIDIGNTGDNFSIFFLNFVRVVTEDKRIDQLLRNPHSVANASCDFLNLYLKRSKLSLGPEDDFPSRVERNLNRLLTMGASTIAAAVRQISPKE